MPNYKKDKEGKQVNSEIDIFLATELGVFSSLKGKNIRLNLRPSNNSKRFVNNKTNETSFVDFHSDISKKVDNLIEKHEQELKTDEPAEVEFVSQKQQVLSLRDIMEVRDSFKKQPEIPAFKTEINTKDVFGEFDPSQDLFEIETPTQSHQDLRFVGNFEELYDVAHVANIEDEPRIWDVGDKESKKWTMGLAGIKVKHNKDKKTGKRNGVAKTKEELEKAKMEIERKKHEIKEAEIIAKEKQEELKEKEKEKVLKEKGEERRKKLEFKKEQEENRKREKELKEEAKIKEEKKKLREKLKTRELKEQAKLEAEQIKLEEKENILKQKETEKQKKLESKKALEEERLNKKRLEEQGKETERAERLKEKEKLLTTKQKERLETEQQKLKEKKLLAAEKQKKLEVKKAVEEERLKEKETEKKSKETVKKDVKSKKAFVSIFKKKKEKTTAKEEKPVSEVEAPKPEEKTEQRDETILDDEVSDALTIIDELLEQLPDEVIDDFVQSDNFTLYERVVKKYKK